MKHSRADLVPALLALLMALPSPGCATLFRTGTRPIPVTSSPGPSMITVNRKTQGQTPIEIRLIKRRRGQIIRIESPGYDPLEIRVGQDATAPNYVTDALLGAAAGGLIALAQASAKDHHDFWTALAVYAPAGAAIRILIDLLIGAADPPRSRELLVKLTKAVGPPRVETMSIAAEEFKTVKWIRIHGD